MLYIQAALQQKYHVEFPMTGIPTAVELAAQQNQLNRLQDYLLSLQWDGKPRLDTWLPTYTGSPGTTYEKLVGRLWMIGAVARASTPGCKNDHILVFEGKQGVGKSTTAQILGGEFYLSKLPNVREYERAAHAISGRWVVEIGELDAFRGAAITQVKDFLTIDHDHFRAPYQHLPKTRARTCCFIGTTNDATYLRDASGARRFWPVRFAHCKKAELIRDRDQLWAEAYRLFLDGAEWHPAREHTRLLETEQNERQEVDAWESIIFEYIEEHDEPLTMMHILAKILGIPKDKWNHSDQMRVGAIMKRLGYKRVRHRISGGRDYFYEKDE